MSHLTTNVIANLYLNAANHN